MFRSFRRVLTVSGRMFRFCAILVIMVTGSRDLKADVMASVVLFYEPLRPWTLRSVWSLLPVIVPLTSLRRCPRTLVTVGDMLVLTLGIEPIRLWSALSCENLTLRVAITFVTVL